MASARNSSLEVEIKLPVRSATAAKRLLKTHDFRVVKPRVFEVNTLFDTPESHLRSTASLLRVREVKGETRLTFKGPPQASKHKKREELEVDASDAQILAVILERLGFQRVFRYEKYRTEYGHGPAGVVTLDETPIGVYLELEGPPRWIDATARLLGFGEPDYITASYGRLYLDWCAAQAREAGDMVFG